MDPEWEWPTKTWLSQSSQTSEKPSHKLSFFFSASDINFRSWNKSKSRETNGMMGFRSPEESLPHTRASASKIWCLVMVLPRPQGFHGNAMLINVAVVYKKVLDICTYVYTISYMYIHYIRYTNYKYNVQYIWCYIYIHTTRMLQLHRRHGNLPRLCSLGAGRLHLKQLTGVPHVCPPTILLTWVIYGEIYWNLCWNMVKYGDIW